MKLKIIIALSLYFITNPAIPSSCLKKCPISKINSDLIAITRAFDTETTEKKQQLHPFIRQFTDEKTGLVGFKDKNNTIIIKPQYKAAYEFNPYGITNVVSSADGKWYKVNTSGQKIVKCYIFDNGPDYEHLGLSRYEDNGKIGFISSKGEIIADAKYDWACPFFFSKPIAVVCIGCIIKKPKFCCDYEIEGGKWGIINDKGKVLLPLEFTKYSIEKDGSLILQKNDEKYKIFIHKSGEIKALKQ